MDTPLALLPDAPPLEEDVVDAQNWQETVEPHILLSLSSREIDCQAVIYGKAQTQPCCFILYQAIKNIYKLKIVYLLYFQNKPPMFTLFSLSVIYSWIH